MSQASQVYGPVPLWWDQRARRKVLQGFFRVRPSGQITLVGGHASGRGWLGKTEFPANWDGEQIDKALLLAWNEPMVAKLNGDRRSVRRIVDEVVVEVSAYGPAHEFFRAYFPWGGLNVIRNTENGRVNVPLDMSLLHQRGWQVL